LTQADACGQWFGGLVRRARIVRAQAESITAGRTGDSQGATVGLLHRRREEVTEHHVELVRDAYRSPRAWEMRPVRELLASDVPGRESAWCVTRGVLSSSCEETDDLARELVTRSVPAHWEITGVDVHKLTPSHDRIVVVGAITCRPRGSSDSIKLPFLHIWYIRDSRLKRVVSSLDSTEVRRAA
jgi:hypothetical protein